MICKTHKIQMDTGTEYDGKHQRRYDECPICHIKVFNNGKNFQAVLENEIDKSKRK